MLCQLYICNSGTDSFFCVCVHSPPACAAPQFSAFHASPRREEDAAKEPETAPAKGGLFGTGLSEWFALPIGIAAAVPLIHFDIYVINEETQLLAVFVAFCVAMYTQVGDSIYESLDEKAKILLKEHTEAEDKVISALEEKLGFLKANSEQVEHFQAINALREKAYEDLNAAGAVKPKHDFKVQVERLLSMIATEEASVAEKLKVSLMSEATASVEKKFAGNKALKKAALDAAIAQIKGTSKEGAVDPVRAEFVEFFKAKAASAAASKDDTEAQEQRKALIAKMNAVAKSEGFFFQFDDSGVPKMVV